jgi:outer membrane protein OmpA-like peptidoglycan-associated protein
MKFNKNQQATLLISFLAFFLVTCNASRTQKGGAIGAGTGAVIGGVIGNQSDNTAVGAIIGATVGGAAGALIGRHMDKQAEELQKDLEGATVVRIGEGIKITFDSGILFRIDSYKLNEASRKNLNDLAATLKKYNDTNILIEGHTDSSGSEAYNLDLSKMRANNVMQYLSSHEVTADRMTSVGYGETQPIADNKTAEGMSQNRRVEVAIYANDRMKRAAKNGEI